MAPRWLAALGAGVAWFACVQAADPEPALKPVKLADFTKAVAAHQGKVVVVDMWQIT